MTRRRGFTLIELLVVIAIIGILAAMLFPVFARARESARKTQCLANVKNIAIAINMYLVDWENFPPIGYESDKRAAEYFRNFGINERGKAEDSIPEWPGVCNHVRQANPYARDAVILDEYVKNRDVWRCPSAKVINSPGFICPAGRDGWWVNNFIDHPNWYDDWTAPPCTTGYPTGWGGEVTDSFVQGPLASENGMPAKDVFASGIGVFDSIHFTKAQAVNDAAKFVVVTDNGATPYPWNLQTAMFPDYSICGFCYCGSESRIAGLCCNDDETDPNCPALTEDQKIQFLNDGNFRKTLTRHMGGSNIGFMDGHAKWIMAQAMLDGAPPAGDATENICWCPDYNKGYTP